MRNSRRVQKASGCGRRRQIDLDSKAEPVKKSFRESDVLIQIKPMYDDLPTEHGRTSPRQSNGVLQSVFGAMKLGKKRSSKASPVSSENGTPTDERGQSKTPPTKRHLWTVTSENEGWERNNHAVLAAAVLKKISDDPSHLFQMAAAGKVEEISSVCNAEPERVLTRDEKGASVLHHAASKGRLTLMNFILSDQEGKSLLEAQDNEESTPLLWAVVNDNAKAVELLISNGADPTALNNRGEPPIFSSIRANCMKALRALIRQKDVIDLNQPQGSMMRTAMHVAAELDNEEAVKMLIEGGGRLCATCQLGYSPLHMAALHGSRKVMKIMIETGKEYGYTSQQVLSSGDKELCSPLYCAVLGGNADAIEMCLSYGARLDTQQADKSTPMHVVCAQGAQDIVENMFNLAKDQATKTLSMQDKQHHTPLHKAAMYGHALIVEYLAKRGADLDIADKELNTPLLLAASRGNWISVRDLIGLGANIMVKNKENRNFLHMIVLGGGDIRNLDVRGKANDGSFSESCRSILSKPEVHDLLNQADSMGCTPLHYACQEGNLASLETLMTLGVSAKLKSAGNKSPLHFAARYGRFNACKRLINSSQGPNIINERDADGMTPLHYAAENGHTKVVQLLLNRGAVCHGNLRGESVLHVTAASGYTRTIKILVAMNRTLLDSTDEEGNTPLHHAAFSKQVSALKLLLDLGCKILRNTTGNTFFTQAIKSQNREISLAIVQHCRWEEAMQEFFKSKDAIQVPSLLLIQYLPDIWVTALDQCVHTADTNPKSKDYWIKYQFKYLQPNAQKKEELVRKMKEIMMAGVEKNAKTSDGKEDAPMSVRQRFALPALNKMVQYNRVECLRHPVSSAYLQMKWNAYGRWVHRLNLFIYVLGLIPLTYLICTTDPDPSYHNEATWAANGTNRLTSPVVFTTVQTVMMIILTVFAFGQLVKEVVQMCQQKQKYFLDTSNLIEWILYVTILLYVVPFFTRYPFHWQYECGSIAVYLAWFNLLLFFQRFGVIGIYVVMFIAILETLVKVLALFSFLIVAFSLSFFLLMKHEQDLSFSSPALSIMRVITMTMGEISYVDKFLAPFVDNSDETLHYPIASLILLLVFIIMMPILLMNLLIGLAVGDIAQVQSNAELQRLAMQVQLHTEIENKLSARLLRMVDKDELIIYPNKKCGSIAKALSRLTAKDETVPGFSQTQLSSTDRNISYLNVEVQKQKDRLKDMQATLGKQHELLRLIVEKMEIRSEADEQDEGVRSTVQRSPTSSAQQEGGRVAFKTKLAAASAFRSTAK